MIAKASDMQAHVIPAQPGFWSVYADDLGVYLGAPIIAWKIDTYPPDEDGYSISDINGVEPGGLCAGNCIGYQYPNGVIVTPHYGGEHVSLDALQCYIAQERSKKG
jgi:hypothetical protein